MIIGLAFSLLANVMWGLIFIGPLLIPEYPGALQSAGRYIAFGVIAIPLFWYDRTQVFKLLREDWFEASKLVFVGNLMYYACLAHAIQHTGSLISTIIIGTLPAVLTVSANIYSYDHNGGKLSWVVLIIGLIFIMIGLTCINLEEIQYGLKVFNFWEYCSGVILALIAVICWTWYALRNARWIKNHPYINSMTWSIAQGVVLLPMASIFYGIVCISFTLVDKGFILPWGPRPKTFIILMIFIGFFCSCLGTCFWNEASRRLPTVLMGPLIVFETIFGLLYNFMYRQIWPSCLTLIGILFLVIGVLYISGTKIFLMKKYIFVKNSK